MRTVLAVGVAAVAVAAPARGEDAPPAPTPRKQHEWLARLAGEWEVRAEATTAPGQPPVKCTGTESVRLLGKMWAVCESKSVVLGTPMGGLLQIGYDPAKGRYVGTFVCSAEPTLWRYEGEADGDKLTLNTEGPNPATGKTVKMRDVIELKGTDEKVITSQALGDDGKWVTFMTSTAKRKK